MSSETKKKAAVKTETAEQGQKSKAVNALLWIVAVVLIGVAAVGNAYFSTHFHLALRVVLIVLLLGGALGAMALTNQGKRALVFMRSAKAEVRHISWPTRPEATQTTLIVVAMALLVAFGLWGLDTLIVTIIEFIMNL